MHVTAVSEFRPHARNSRCEIMLCGDCGVHKVLQNAQSTKYVSYSNTSVTLHGAHVSLSGKVMTDAGIGLLENVVLRLMLSALQHSLHTWPVGALIGSPNW